MKKIIFVLLLLSSNAFGQTDNRFSSVDGIIGSLYASISGEVGKPRDWNTFTQLFDSSGRLQSVGVNRKLRTLTPADYIRNGSRLVDIGFQEKEIHRITEIHGAITHIFSTYEGHYTANGKEETMRGINSIQLFFDGQRYYILSIVWDGDTRNNPIKPQHLGKQ